MGRIKKKFLTVFDWGNLVGRIKKLVTSVAVLRVGLQKNFSFERNRGVLTKNTPSMFYKQYSSILNSFFCIFPHVIDHVKFFERAI